ncbi:MAG: M20/M25/M40 family metallo-hydrolase [bacterium]
MPLINENRLDEYIRSIRGAYEKLLGSLVEIPTVSADPACSQAIRKAALLTVRILKRFGVQAEILKTSGHPVVIGALGTNKKNPTILVYNHLDVQPADRSEWDQDPFRLTIKAGRYGGRGATDDKGPALTALFAAKYAMGKGVPLNFRFVWEFEEEIGSPNFEKAVRSIKAFLHAQSILVSDTVWLSGNNPAIPYGLRGLLTAGLELETGDRDIHSGLAGGAARNPIGELCELITRCYDPHTGRVKIPGFYDDVLSTGREERQRFSESGFRTSDFKKAHGFKKIRFDEAAKIMDAIWSKPTFEVHGIAGGYTGKGIKTVVPQKAEAKISMRLVPGQNPRKILSQFRAFVKLHNPDISVRGEAYLDPYFAAPGGEHLQAAVDAVYFGFRKRAVLVREGGSIGAVVSLNKLLHAPVVLLGLSLPEHGYHAPNEYFEWRQVRGGIRTFVRYFEQVCRIR